MGNHRSTITACSIPSIILLRSTLQDRISGKVLPGASTGPQRYLDDDEEAKLVRFITRCSEIGYSRTKRDIICMVQRLCDHKGLQVQVSSGWWASFQKRHPTLTIRCAESIARARVIASDSDALERYYDELEKTLLDNGLWESPASIFNCDETGMPLSPGASKVVAPRGEKHPYQVASGDKAHITALVCASAAGYAIPPMVIFDWKFLNPQLTIGEVPGTFYGLSDSGWMDTHLFNEWFCNHFLKYAPSSRPLLLLLDGHSSHFQPAVVEMAAAEEVIIFCLPPHTTHITQPLDNGAFGALKLHWKEACREHMILNPGQVVTRYTFSQLFCKAYSRAFTIGNIMGSFRDTGVYPFNRKALLPPESEPNLAQKSGLAYIPLFSPRPQRARKQHMHAYNSNPIKLKQNIHKIHTYSVSAYICTPPG